MIPKHYTEDIAAVIELAAERASKRVLARSDEFIALIIAEPQRIAQQANVDLMDLIVDAGLFAAFDDITVAGVGIIGRKQARRDVVSRTVQMIIDQKEESK